jgi:glycosyltransferase involved in cell wall biosynthesis
LFLDVCDEDLYCLFLSKQSHGGVLAETSVRPLRALLCVENNDVAVVSSHTENFGMVVAEALAHGVPVIASKGT